MLKTNNVLFLFSGLQSHQSVRSQRFRFPLRSIENIASNQMTKNTIGQRWRDDNTSCAMFVCNLIINYLYKWKLSWPACDLIITRLYRFATITHEVNNIIPVGVGTFYNSVMMILFDWIQNVNVIVLNLTFGRIVRPKKMRIV